MLSLARAVHVIGVLWWAGGVLTVTATILPALRHSGLPESERAAVFARIRRRFAWQARVATLLVGASGAYLITYLGGIARLRPSLGWWIDLMIVTWSVFALLLFVLEPLGIMHRAGLARRPAAFLTMHVVLSALLLATVACGVIGSHGGIF